MGITGVSSGDLYLDSRYNHLKKLYILSQLAQLYLNYVGKMFTLEAELRLPNVAIGHASICWNGAF